MAAGIGYIWLDDINCVGTETKLIDCANGGLGTHNCLHQHDVGVSCHGTTCTEGAIRLLGGTAAQGRVEICHNHIWNTVCDEGWDDTDAMVTCYQLGLPSTSMYVCT